MRSSGEVLEVSCSVLKSVKQNAADVQVKRWVGSITVKYEREHRETMQETPVVVRDVVYHTEGKTISPRNVHIVQDEIFEDGALLNLQDMIQIDDSGSSAFERIQQFCRKHVLAVPKKHF